MNKPLAGIRVLDLTTFVAAPCAGRLLSDLGAEVIKVEKNSGDGWRDTSTTYCSKEFSHDENPIYDLYNLGKKHITLNLKTPEGLEAFDKIMATSDIFLTNTRLAGLQRLGIDYESVKEKYPRLIYAMVEGFGEKGPDAPTAAFDTTGFWARCGMLRDLAVVSESGDYNPIYPPSSVGDTVTAFLLLSEINAALYQREHTGRGQLVKAGLFHTGVFTFGTMAVAAQRPYGKEYPRRRFQHSILAGYFKCADGNYIYIATGVVALTFQRVAKAIGRPNLYEEDERFTTIAKRYEHAEEFYNLLRDAFIQKTSDEWIKICKSVDLAVTKVNGFADINEDEQALANDYIQDVTYRTGRTIKVASSPLDMECLKGADMHTYPAVLSGENTEEVLKSVGYTDEQIKDLYDREITKPTNRK